jgi:Putative auto-transporter adhesin, head GIN domain
MKWRSVVVSGTLPLMVAACSTTTGSGTLRTQTRAVSGFTTVELTGVGDVLIEQNGTESLTIAAEDNLLPDLTSEVSDGTLRLGTRNGKNLAPTRGITYRVTVENLAGLRLTGSGSQTATKISATTIAIDITGSGNITTKGVADAQTVSISGSGKYSAGSLATKSTTAQISGNGDATLNVRDTLKVDISGSGSISYTGDPKVTQDISGSGKLTQN